MRDAYIVTSVRTPGCRRGKGAFKDTRPEDLLSFIMKSAVEKAGPISNPRMDDVMIGCSFPEAEQGLNIGRLAGQIAGFPIQVSGATVNRFCSSGLEAIALASLRVMAGWSDITIGGGVESMTYVPMGGNLPRPHPEHTQAQADLYCSMGITAENVANRYNVTREDQDAFAYESQMKATKAQKKACSPRSYPRRRPSSFSRKTAPIKKRPFSRISTTAFAPPRPWKAWPNCGPVFAVNGSVTPAIPPRPPTAQPPASS
jgi:acetyl-CoA acyltransferase